MTHRDTLVSFNHIWISAWYIALLLESVTGLQLRWLLCAQSSPFLQPLQAKGVSTKRPLLEAFLLTDLCVCRGRKATTTTLVLATLKRIPITNNKTNWIILPFVFKMGFVFSPCQTIFYRDSLGLHLEWGKYGWKDLIYLQNRIQYVIQIGKQARDERLI